MDEQTISVAQLHGSALVSDPDGGERKVYPITCDDYPDCDTCGHYDEDLVDTDDEPEEENGWIDDDWRDGRWSNAR